MSNITLGAEYIPVFPDIAPLYVGVASYADSPVSGATTDQLLREDSGVATLVDDASLPGSHLEFASPLDLVDYPASLSTLTPTSVFHYEFGDATNVSTRVFKVWEFAPFPFGKLATAHIPGGGGSSGFSYLFAEDLDGGELFALFIDDTSGHTVQIV